MSGQTICRPSESRTHPVRYIHTKILPNKLLLSLDTTMDSGVAVGVCRAKYLGSLDLDVGICGVYYLAQEPSLQRGLDS
jgi:hypothetical protein